VDPRGHEGQHRALVNFHSFRRWFITMAERAGQPPHVFKAVVGHARAGMALGVYSGGPSVEEQQKADWRQRKEAYVGKLHDKPIETILVSCADKLHNARDIMFEYDKIGDDIWDRFNPSKQETLWYYASLAMAFEQAWPDNPLLPDFKAIVRRMQTAIESN